MSESKFKEGDLVYIVDRRIIEEGTQKGEIPNYVFTVRRTWEEGALRLCKIKAENGMTITVLEDNVAHLGDYHKKREEAALRRQFLVIGPHGYARDIHIKQALETYKTSGKQPYTNKRPGKGETKVYLIHPETAVGGLGSVTHPAASPPELIDEF